MRTGVGFGLVAAQQQGVCVTSYPSVLRILSFTQRRGLLHKASFPVSVSQPFSLNPSQVAALMRVGDEKRKQEL